MAEERGWTVQVVEGFPLLRAPGGVGCAKDDLFVGDIVYCAPFGGEAYMKGTVQRDDHGELYVETKDHVLNINYSNDERECWVASSVILKRAMQRGIII